MAVSEWNQDGNLQILKSRTQHTLLYKTPFFLALLYFIFDTINNNRAAMVFVSKYFLLQKAAGPLFTLMTSC